MASHVPGGVGVIEAVVLEMVPYEDKAILLGTLLAFRAIYYLLPLAVAICHAHHRATAKRVEAAL